MIYKDSFIEKHEEKKGVSLDKANTYTFDTEFKNQEVRKENPKKRITYKFHFRGFEFTGSTMPYFFLMALIIIISIINFVSGNVGEGVQGIVLLALTFLAYNYAYIKYDNNHNLLLWNVTTTLQAFLKYTAYKLIALDSKILLVGVIGSMLAHLRILQRLNVMFIYMIIFGGFLTFVNRKTGLLSVALRSYGIMLIVISVMANVFSLANDKMTFVNAFDIITFLILYSLGAIIGEIEIKNPM